MKLLLLLAVAATITAALAQPKGPASTNEQPPDPKLQPKEPDKDKHEFRALVFTKTGGFRHDCIPDGIAAIKKLGAENNFAVDATEDAAQFNAVNLDKYSVVVFMCTTTEVLDSDQQTAFEGFIASGHGYAGIHSAADTEYDWPWYGQLVGAYFKSHPQIQPALIRVEEQSHPSTKHLGEEWKHTDEWYDYKESPRGACHILMSLDQSSYTGSTMQADHPIAWCHEFRGGRAWYTGLGHTKECYTDATFLQHILGGIRWAAGKAEWKQEEKKPATTNDN
ncbi:MAG: ThuA domain-containing protein [Phycisphaerales bacterium]|nr:ThuA domain-containing protein [Phycisphaerales bacterium]